MTTIKEKIIKDAEESIRNRKELIDAFKNFDKIKVNSKLLPSSKARVLNTQRDWYGDGIMIDYE